MADDALTPDDLPVVRASGFIKYIFLKKKSLDFAKQPRC
jgi:hypothetical protein